LPATTALGERIAALIRVNGPITVADYMALCLADPEHGYYMAREPFGRSGDFVTAPEVSQMFGELIGVFVVTVWQAMGSPSRFVLAELGPGRGTLMADLLRTARLRPAFLDAAELSLVETSPRLREIQAAALSAGPLRPAFYGSLDELPRGPMIVIANEFFDALPIHQFVRTEEGWGERRIGLDENGALVFGLMPVAHPSLDSLARVPVGAVMEVWPAATSIAESLGRRLVADGGAALVIDYGYAGPSFGDTLQAIAGHRFADPLAAPGEADLTAHVDFTSLAAAAARGGGAPRPLMTQGTFLRRLGIIERAEALIRGKDESTRKSIAGAAGRLVGAETMGKLFKVLAISSPGLVLPVFDDKPQAAGTG
jgi:SAM-dependent MidA family methyltransferase